MVYAAPELPLLLLLLMLPLLPCALSPGRVVGMSWAALAVAVLSAGDGGGDGMPVLTSNPPPGPACPAGRVVESHQLAGCGIDAVGAGLNVGARSNAGLLGSVVSGTTTTFVMIIGHIRHLSGNATTACVTYEGWVDGQVKGRVVR